MCCRCLLKFISRCLMAVYEGFIEFCQKGCLVGSQYLVKPNYHPCERALWLVIYLICSSLGIYLIYFYMKNYSQNIYRIVTEEHDRHQVFRYPTLGICETADSAAHDEQTFIRVQQALNNSLYKKFNILSKNNATNHFLHFLSYQSSAHRSHAKRKEYHLPIQRYMNYTLTLEKDVQTFLDNFDYRTLINRIIGSCEDIFHECEWLGEHIECCEVFREVPSMLGKCFLFNSHQNYSLLAAQLIEKIQIYAEPYHFVMKFKRPVNIFILNNRDIPETLRPLDRPKLTADDGQLILEFTTMPIISDKSLQYLDPKILRCVEKDTDCLGKCLESSNHKLYPFESYTTCITTAYYKQQYKKCGCVNINAATGNASLCKLSQYACLEREGFINPTSMAIMDKELLKDCLPNCDDSEYFVENRYSRPSNLNQNSLDFILLNFPKTHKRRQVIRQSEDKLVSLSGILGLFMGLNTISIIEFLYLTCCAYWKRNKKKKKANTNNKTRQGVAKPHKPIQTQWARTVKRKLKQKTQAVTRQIVYQP